MNQIELLPIDAGLHDQVRSSGLATLCSNAAQVADIAQAVVEATLAFQSRSDARPPWIGYLAVDAADRSLIGTCSFKGGPKGGAVEIAYFTFEPFEGRGYAGAMAERLVDIARKAPDVTAVAAQTLPAVNASTKVLQKHGFVRDGVAQDDEAGEVWCWRLPL
jgi:[ribosomal protein S5]-alanine N-acetyltransferase